MANAEQNNHQVPWIKLSKEAAAEMDRPLPNYVDVEQKLLRSLELLSADRSYSDELRCIDQSLIVSTLAFAYAGQRKFALSCRLADRLVQSVLNNFPANNDANLWIWIKVLSKMEHLYIATGHNKRALAVAERKHEALRELTNCMLEIPEDFPGCEDLTDKVMSHSQSALRRIWIHEWETQAAMEKVTSLVTL